MKNLAVSEAFYSIQGEGASTGVPAVFLRLGGCNLLCKSEQWTCDTIDVWSKSKSTLFEEVLKDEWVEQLRAGAHLVVTGGEPLAHKNLSHFLFWFNLRNHFLPFTEVETNGTIAPPPYLRAHLGQAPELFLQQVSSQRM
jgi:organic radical activating enzyme